MRAYELHLADNNNSDDNKIKVDDNKIKVIPKQILTPECDEFIIIKLFSEKTGIEVMKSEE